MAQILIQNENLNELIKQQADTNMPKKVSELENDSKFVTSSGSVASVSSAGSTVKVTGATGTASGNFGGASNVTLGSTGSASISVPYFKVNEQGLITQVTNRTLSMTTGCSNCSHCSVYNNCSQCSNCNICDRCSRTCSNCSDCSDICGCQP